MPLKVIGAGYPRTGTLSLKLALEHLGFGPCHHMIEVIHNPAQALLWAHAYDEDGIDFDEVLKGYNSSCDAPSCFMYRELAARYPDAKVVLSIRSAESWWKSASSTVMKVGAGGPPFPAVRDMMENIAKYAQRHGRPIHNPAISDPEAAMSVFNRHNEEVRRTIPRERLLVFEAKQGWEPLCKFLGVPVPSIPYPRVNTTEEFQAGFAEGKPPPIPRLQS